MPMRPTYWYSGCLLLLVALFLPIAKQIIANITNSEIGHQVQQVPVMCVEKFSSATSIVLQNQTLKVCVPS